MLTINLFSFSYLKSGIPDDDSGNGGGFVFDCRYLYNPGKFPEYSEKTGLDPEVVELLESKQDMQSFLNNIKNIIRPAIENYIERDFTNLFVAFGCTGGQHRSVYSAEKLLEYIEEKFPKVRIILTHQELRKM